jgi:hypothetical protein
MTPTVIAGEVMRLKEIKLQEKSLNKIDLNDCLKGVTEAAEKKYSKNFFKLKEEVIQFSKIHEELKNNENSFA